MARPRKEEQVLSKTIAFRVTEEEHAKLQEKAKNAGMTLSNFCYHIIKKKRIQKPTIIPEANQEALFQIKRAGVNLNQATRKLNEITTVATEETMEKIKSELGSAAHWMRVAVSYLKKGTEDDSQH